VARVIEQNLVNQHTRQLEAYKAESTSQHTRQLEAYKAETRSQGDARLAAHKAELKAGLDAELARVRDQLTQANDQLAQAKALQTVATSALVSAHTAATERRLQANDELWRTTRRIRKTVNDLVLNPLDALTAEELEEAHTNPKLESPLQRLGWGNLDLQLLETDESEVFRPILGDALWSRFHAYQTFLVRVVVFYAMSLESERKLRHWQHDPLLRKLLTEMLTEDERAYVHGSKVGMLARAELVLEARLIRLAHELSSGQPADEKALEQALRLTRVAAFLDPDAA
jgi:hypothetical protein